MAHELGHFSNFDTLMSLITIIGNFPMSIILKGLTNLVKRLKKCNWIIKILAFPVYWYYWIFSLINFISSLILMHLCRRHEYWADMFALECGFGTEINAALIEIYHASIHKPGSIKEQLRSTHPDITKRIERLEDILVAYMPRPD